MFEWSRLAAADIPQVQSWRLLQANLCSVEIIWISGE